MSVKFTVRYEAGHIYEEIWEHTDLFCPRCSTKAVWREESSGDYYVGENYLCMSCDQTFTIQGPNHAEGWQNNQRLEAIKSSLGVPYNA